jgi:hypothetical protein
MKRLILALTALLLATLSAYAQVVPGAPQQVAIICASNTSPPLPTVGMFYLVQCDNTGKLLTNATGGGGGGTSSNFGSAFPSAGTAVGAEYLSSPPTLTSGQMVALQTDINGNLYVRLNSTTLTANQGTAGASPWLVTTADGGQVTLGATTDGVWSGSGNSTVTQALRYIGNAVVAPITPCAAANCGAANPIGTVIISGTQGALPAFAATPTVNLGTIAGVATAANQPTNAAQGSTTSGQTGYLMEAATLNSPPTYTTAQTNPVYVDIAGNLQTGNGGFTVAGVTFTVTVASHAPGTVLCCSGGLHGVQLLKTGTAGHIKKISVSSKAVVPPTIGLKVYLFASTPSTTFTDATTPAIVAGDVNLILDVVQLSAADSGLGTHTVWVSPIGYDLPVNNINVYAVPIVTGSSSFTPGTTSDFQMRASGTY